MDREHDQDAQNARNERDDAPDKKDTYTYGCPYCGYFMTYSYRINAVECPGCGRSYQSKYSAQPK